MERRRFILGITIGLLAAPRAAEAQQPERMRRVGVLMQYAENDPEGQRRATAFRQGLGEGPQRQDLAEKAGLSRECIRKLEAGEYDPTVGTLQKLAKALGVPVTELLG